MGKLLALAVGLAEGYYGRWMFKRLVSGVISVIALTIILSMLVGALMIGGFYAGYLALVHAGFEPHIAGLLTLGIIMFTIIIFILIMVTSVRRLRNIPQVSTTEKPALIVKANGVVDSFLEGFLHSPKK